MAGGFDRKPGGGNLVNETFDGVTPVPGKRTLTEQQPPLPVQRTPASLTPSEHVVQRLSEGLDGAPKVGPIATGNGDLVALAHEAQVQRSANSPVPEDAAIHEAAASGIANNAARLPYHDQIQALFGRHDISSVQAHVSGDAGTASRAIGAEAYATGNHVAFATSPGLHAAAHEAAHVVQQRGDVQLKGGVGEAGDQYERHADQVADAVVRGESAEGLLDQYAGGRGAATKPIQRAVQREQAKDVNSRSYFDEHEHEIAATAADQLETFPFATGDPAVKWASGGNRRFATAIAAQIRGGDARLKEIVLPETMGVIVDQSRVMTQKTYTDLADGQEKTEKTQTMNFGPDRYFAGVGLAIANAVARRTNESLWREVPRYVQAKLATVGEPTPNGLLASHPIDPVVLTALAAGGVLDIDQGLFAKEHPELAGSAKSLTALPAGALVQEKDPRRKNWYRLTQSAPASAEQIAVTLFNDQKQAYRIEVAHPLYGVKRWGDENMIENLADDKQDGFIEEIALNQAQTLGVPSTNPPASVIGQIRTNALTIRTSVADAASMLGYGLLGEYADKLSARANRLESANDDTETRKWDVQSRAQFEIIKQASKGLDADRKRQKVYAAQFGVDLTKVAGKDATPEQQRKALQDDATLWAKAVEASDAVKTAEAMLQAAFQHSATLEMDVLEQQLSTPQAAGDLPEQDPESNVNKDMHPEKLGAREVELRKRFGLMRQQVLTDPSKIDASADKLPGDTRKLVFESNVVLQAQQMDQAWKILDDTSGFWAWVTGDSATINRLKSQGAGYYAQWRAIYADIKVKNIDDAQKKYEKLVGDYAFQRFLGTVQQAVKEAQAKQLVAKLIAMVVITIVSMGVGTIVEGLVGGATVIAGAVEGGEAVGAVTTGLGMGRTAGAIAGFIAETGTFSLASNLLMSKDHGATAILTEFGKNIMMFGAMRGLGKLLEVAGVGKIINAVAASDATLGAKAAGLTAKVATDVAMGGAGVLAGIIEAKVEAAIKDKSLSEEQVKEMIRMNVAQAIIMVIVGRLMQSPLRALKIEAAYKGSKWRMAETAAAHLEAISAPHNTENPKITNAQLRDLIQKDLAQIQMEKAAMEEVRATLEKQQRSTAAIDAHLAELNMYGDASASAMLMVGLKAQTPNHFLAPVSSIPVLKVQHTKLGSTWDEVAAKPGEPRTYVVTNAVGERLFISEELPERPGGAPRKHGSKSEPPGPRVGEPDADSPFPHVHQREGNWCGAACGAMAAHRLGIEIEQAQLAAHPEFEPRTLVGHAVFEGGFQTAGLTKALAQLAPAPGRKWVGGQLHTDISTPDALCTHLKGYLTSTKASIILRVAGSDHWIVVDTVQSDGRIAIRDPGEHTPTIVTAEQLRGMVPTGDAVFSFPEKK